MSKSVPTQAEYLQVALQHNPELIRNSLDEIGKAFDQLEVLAEKLKDREPKIFRQMRDVIRQGCNVYLEAVR